VPKLTSISFVAQCSTMPSTIDKHLATQLDLFCMMSYTRCFKRNFHIL